MSTRGVIGFFQNGWEKVTYNHCDSYPDYMGMKMLEFCANIKITKLREIVENIELVGYTEPTPEQIKECNKYFKVSKDLVDDWGDVLWSLQGDLSWYLNGFKYMKDSRNFLKDSLFCEFAYIVNTDLKTLEFYTGYNKNPKANGRYADFKYLEDSEFYGVVLKAEYDLKSITKRKIPEIVKEMNKLSEED